jgi:hypothetical protein
VIDSEYYKRRIAELEAQVAALQAAPQAVPVAWVDAIERALIDGTVAVKVIPLAELAPQAEPVVVVSGVEHSAAEIVEASRQWQARGIAAPQPQASPQAEPVAWQYRRNDSSEWVTLPHWPCLLGDGDERRPLYAAPQPQAAVPEGWPAGRAARAVWDAATKPQAEPVGVTVQSGSVAIPFWVIDYAQKIQLFMRENGADEWAIGGIQSRDLPPPPQPQPQASAEDLRAIDVIGKGDMASQAWKRIRADYERMGVK